MTITPKDTHLNRSMYNNNSSEMQTHFSQGFSFYVIDALSINSENFIIYVQSSFN